MKQATRLNAAETAFFQRQTEQIMVSTYDKLYPEIMARTVFPVSTELNAGAASWKYYQYDRAGKAKIIGSSAKDLPRVTVKGKEFTGNLKQIADAYGYTTDDIRTAAFTGMNLDASLAYAAKEAILTEENDIAFNGNAAYGLPGLFSNTDIDDSAVAADGTGASTSWEDKTGQQIVRDIGYAIAVMKAATKQVESPTDCMIAASAWDSLAYAFVGDTTMTVQNFVKQNFPFIKNWYSLNELETSGTGTTREFILYRKDINKLALHVPLDFTQYEAQPKGLEYEIPCESKCGGLVVPYPKSLYRSYGI
jgi:hypothetical protein